MDLYITQNSYYFVHRHFINVFLRENAHVVYVRETKRGIFKKYYEIIANFGLFNTIFSGIMECVYFVHLSRKVRKFDSSVIDDKNLNIFLEKKVQSGVYNRVFSIGCPCMIDTAIQKRYAINIYNLHGGIIPFQKGRFSPLKGLVNGHPYLGASLYLISDVFDEGALVSQDYFRVDNGQVIGNYNKVLKLSANLLNSFFSGTTTRIPVEIYKDLEQCSR